MEGLFCGSLGIGAWIGIDGGQRRGSLRGGRGVSGESEKRK